MDKTESIKVDWGYNGKFGKLMKFRAAVRMMVRHLQCGVLLQTKELFHAMIQTRLMECYDVQWCEEYGEEATKQMLEGFLDK
jgi:hypothetical protein